MAQREIKNADISSAGTTGIWKPSQGKKLILFDVDIFGYAQASTDHPFLLKVMLSVDGSWFYIGGLRLQSNGSFHETLSFRSGLKSTIGDGSTYVLGTNITANLPLNVYLSAFGNTL